MEKSSTSYLQIITVNWIVREQLTHKFLQVSFSVFKHILQCTWIIHSKNSRHKHSLVLR